MSHDFDYIAYVPFRNYGRGLVQCLYSTVLRGKSMARSTAKNVDLGYTFSVCTTLLAAERRVTGLVTASTGTFSVRERTVRFASKRPLLLVVDLEALSSATLLTHSCERLNVYREPFLGRSGCDRTRVVLSSLALK